MGSVERESRSDAAHFCLRSSAFLRSCPLFRHRFGHFPQIPMRFEILTFNAFKACPLFNRENGQKSDQIAQKKVGNGQTLIPHFTAENQGFVVTFMGSWSLFHFFSLFSQRKRKSIQFHYLEPNLICPLF